MTRPTVSVVIPTFNRWPQLQRTLDALATQTVPTAEVEVIVVSDGSTDGTNEHLEAGRAPLDLVFVSQANSGPAVARNLGVSMSSAELILFVDDDVVARPKWIATHLDAQNAHREPTVVIGPLLSPPGHRFQPWVAWEQDKLEQQYQSIGRGEWAVSARQFYTGNASVRRTDFLRAGGFDTDYRRAEDVQLAYRMAADGVAFTFEPAAQADHFAERSYESWLANASAYGRNDALMFQNDDVDWLVPEIRREYHRRNRLTRTYTAAGLRFPPGRHLGESVAEDLSLVLDRVGAGAIGQRVLSAVYNLAYYDGLISQLGYPDLRSFLADRNRNNAAPLDHRRGRTPSTSRPPG